jgi:electron-transferring-flavoprotein dehydrogenase
MIEREKLEMDVVFVGAGPANLAAALHLKRLIDLHDSEVADGKRSGSKIGEIQIAVIEKGPFVGAHILSGAVMDPIAIKELIPDFLEKGCPVDTQVAEDAFWYLTKSSALVPPVVPPPLKNKGKYIISLSRLCEWLAGQCEQAGINVFPEFPGSELLFDDEGNVVGVRTGDKGVDHEGKPKGNFEAGIDLIAKVTVLGEGPRGSLAKHAISRLGLDDGKEPQVYSLGIKELWEIPSENFGEGKVVHTLGFPSDTQTYGGGWIYGMKNNVVSIGYVTGLDYRDPTIDPHAEFQKFKTHPKVAAVLKGGKMIKYGAKTINAGGWNTMPRLYAGGLLIVGDSGAFLNGQRIKGIHTAMKSGMLAAETITTALSAGDFSDAALASYEDRIKSSWLFKELYPVRNFHGAFQAGRWLALINTGLQFLTGGRAWGLFSKQHHVAGYERLGKTGTVSVDSERYASLKFDKEITFDKATDVFFAGVAHDENQPCHLHVLDTEICATRCAEEYGNPCEKFCPAAVYEMEQNPSSGRRELKVNFSNCVHCKTCDVADPYQIINWVTPEGGGGPNYKGM